MSLDVARDLPLPKKPGRVTLAAKSAGIPGNVG